MSDSNPVLWIVLVVCNVSRSRALSCSSEAPGRSPAIRHPLGTAEGCWHPSLARRLPAEQGRGERCGWGAGNGWRSCWAEGGWIATRLPRTREPSPPCPVSFIRQIAKGFVKAGIARDRCVDSVSGSVVGLLAVGLNALCREAGCLQEAKLLSRTQPVQVSRWMWHWTLRSAQFSAFLTYKPAKFCWQLVLLLTQVSVSSKAKRECLRF